MKIIKIILFTLPILISISSFAKELVCNDGAMVIRENQLPKAQRSWPDPDLIASVYNEDVVNYLERTFGFSGDGAYGKSAYIFTNKVLTISIYGSGQTRNLNEQEFVTSGKFSTAIIKRDNRGARLELVGSGRSANWYFERCKLVGQY